MKWSLENSSILQYHQLNLLETYKQACPLHSNIQKEALVKNIKRKAILLGNILSPLADHKEQKIQSQNQYQHNKCKSHLLSNN
jgi:hypothetical protein